MKARAMHPEDEKALSQMIENGYVMKDDVVTNPDDAERIERIKNHLPSNSDKKFGSAKEKRLKGDELPTVINSPDTDAELAIPMDTPPKEVKLHKTPLKVLTDELERIRLSYTVRNGGMRGIPKSIRNRINRLEKVIGIKTEVYKRAMEQANESGRISEDT